MPKGGRNLEKVLVVINYCSYVEFLEVAYRQKIPLGVKVGLGFSRSIKDFEDICGRTGRL